MKALREQGLLPRVIAGSSVGSIGAHVMRLLARAAWSPLSLQHALILCSSHAVV